MVCKSYTAHIRDLIIKEKLVIWKCLLSNGEEVWSDYNTEEKDPWVRLKHYCNNNGIDILEVRVVAYGIREQVVYEDPEGLDGIFIVRGICKDLTTSSVGLTFNYLAFGKLNPETNLIETTKFHWPECEFEDSYEEREVTDDNLKLLYTKTKQCGDNCVCQNSELT